METENLKSDCCNSDMIPPDEEMMETAGSLWRAYACYICVRCGNACEAVKAKDQSTNLKKQIEEATSIIEKIKIYQDAYEIVLRNIENILAEELDKK